MSVRERRREEGGRLYECERGRREDPDECLAVCVCVVGKKGIAEFEKPAMQPKGAVSICTFV